MSLPLAAVSIDAASSCSAAVACSAPPAASFAAASSIFLARPAVARSERPTSSTLRNVTSMTVRLPIGKLLPDHAGDVDQQEHAVVAGGDRRDESVCLLRDQLGRRLERVVLELDHLARAVG